MKVILLQDVKGQGKKDDVIEVSQGYANNFLIKNKLAVLYTAGSKKILDSQIKQRNDDEQALVDSLNVIKNKLNNKELLFKVKTGKEDKVFGNISSKQISDKLTEMGYKIDKKCILIDHSLDTLGSHNVTIKLHKKVEFEVIIKLVK